MLAIILSLFTALFESLKDVFSKIGLRHEIDEYVLAWSLRFFTLIFTLPLLFFIKIPLIGDDFWKALLAEAFLGTIIIFLYFKALKFSDLSLNAPMATFTPVFLLITSPLIVGEFPDILGLTGVILIFFGSYLLNVKDSHNGYLLPFKTLLSQKGPKIMLLVAFLWSITSNISKIGIKNSSPIFWVISLNIIGSLILLPLMIYKARNVVLHIPKHIKFLIPIGLFSALLSVFQMFALQLTLVVYVISIKRLSALFSVLFGYFLFRETGLKERLLGTIVMVIGAFVIGFSQLR